MLGRAASPFRRGPLLSGGYILSGGQIRRRGSSRYSRLAQCAAGPPSMASPIRGLPRAAASESRSCRGWSEGRIGVTEALSRHFGRTPLANTSAALAWRKLCGGKRRPPGAGRSCPRSTTASESRRALPASVEVLSWSLVIRVRRSVSGSRPRVTAVNRYSYQDFPARSEVLETTTF